MKKKKVPLRHHITGHHKAHKPFLKRHISFLSFFALAATLLAIQLIGGLLYNSELESDSKSLSESLLQIHTPTEQQTINSSLNLSVSYNPASFQAKAKVEDTEYNDLDKLREYTQIQFTPLFATETNTSSLKIYIEDSSDKSLEEISQKYADKTSGAFTVTKTVTDKVINSHTYLRQEFTSKPKLSGLSKVKSVLLATMENNRVYVIKISGLATNETEDMYDSILQSINYSSISSYLPKNEAKSDPFNIFQAVHASSGTAINSELVARSLPAVVKIYNISCGNILYLNQLLASGCYGGSGSGFLLSNDGYVGTNGHVAAISVKDVVFNSIISSPDILERMLDIEGYSQQEISAYIDNIQSDPSLIASAASLVYDLKDSQIQYGKNHQSHILVALGEKIPNINSLTKGKSIKDSQYIKNAELIDYDYDSSEVISGEFTKSDVAILKIDGANYPYIRTGTIEEVVQGSNIIVMGFPGTAENALVDTSVLEPSTTTGVVSAIRDTNDGKHKIIQSDVSISHGSSGGPAISNDSGNVVGLATYVYDNQQSGNDSISYMRDISDLLGLASENQLTLNLSGDTQSIWEKGLSLFFEAKYSESIKSFEETKEAYPPHRLADAYISLAEAKIANGEEVVESSKMYLFIIGIAISTIGVASAISLIVLHHRRHIEFKNSTPQPVST